MEKKEMIGFDGPNGSEVEHSPAENRERGLGLSKREITLFPILTSEDEIATSFPFFLPAAKQTAEGWRSPFLYIAEHLKREGFSGDLQKIALIDQIALNSAHLDNAICVEQFENASGQAATLLNIAASLTPESYVKRIDKLTQDDFFRREDQWMGIALSGTNSTGFEKVKEKLNQFLIEKKLVEEGIERTRKRDIQTRFELKGPTACVLATKDPTKPILTHPSFLHLHLPPISMRGVFERDTAEEGRIKAERNIINVSFERFIPHIVKVPFANQFLALLQQPQYRAVFEKGETFLKMIRLITIVHNSPALTQSEALGRLSKIPLSVIDAARGLPARVPATLTAGKREYYICRVLLSGLLRKGIPLTAKQKCIFQTIKIRNIGRLDGAKELNKYEQLAAIVRTPQTWARQEQILEEVNRGAEVIADIYQLFLELQTLVGKGVIQERRIPDLKDVTGYFVTRFDVEDIITLPNPDEVCDSSCGEGKISVQNPITGEMEAV